MSDKRKKLMIFGAVVLLAAVGAIVGVIVARDSSDNTSTGDGTSSAASDSTTSSTGSNAGTVNTGGSSTSSSSSNSTGSASAITSDPTTATYTLAAFAVGDWGTTVAKDSCCSDSSTYTNFDVIAEDAVATLMNLQAGDAEVKPSVIIGHGDNFYWTGINDDVDTRFDTTFEKKFAGENIIDIPWVNVMGNHDYGGSSYICLDGTDLAKCSSTDAMLTALEKKFTWQQEYTSANSDRWKLTDHFYKYTITDDSSGVSIDIFNIDTNDANTHGAQEICCQCYGYAEGDDDSCENIARGDAFCCGGDTDMYDQCVAKITEWADDSRTQLKTEVAASTATWKVVNSHYSPYVHYDESGQTEWFKILKDSGVQLWLNGHTHGEKHDYAESLAVHFVENGAGGGIVKQSASGIPTYATDYVSNVWSYSGQEYGFFSLTASEEWLKLQYHTANSDWSMGSTLSETTIGTVATKHCWYIPVNGGEGKTCDS